MFDGQREDTAGMRSLNMEDKISVEVMDAQRKGQPEEAQDTVEQMTVAILKTNERN